MAVLCVGPVIRLTHAEGTSAVLSSTYTAVSLVFATAAFARLQLSVCRGGETLRMEWAVWVITALAVVPMFTGSLSLTLGYALAAQMVSLPVLRAAIASTVTCALYAVLYPRVTGLTSVGVIQALVEMLAVAAIFVVVTRLAVVLDDLTLTREVLARRQVDVERERIGRDLHDLMGRTLVAASLRNQTALRALGDQNAQATATLERLHDTISRGQAQLRALTSGPAIATLADELQTARMLCERVNILLEIDVRERPPAAHEALVALVIRENITNVLKHSRATTCEITLDQVAGQTRVTVVNDGLQPNAIADSEDSADSRLTRAVAAAHGSLASGPLSETTYSSVATIPTMDAS